MERDAYSSDMTNLIMSYFPNIMQTDLQMKMEGLSDDGNSDSIESWITL